jgi:hypothetical protein
VNKIREWVQSQSENTLRQLVADQETFEAAGMIGDCLLRQKAEQLGELLGEGSRVVLWMDRIAYESYRELYLRTEM